VRRADPTTAEWLAPGVVEVAAFRLCRDLAHEAGFQSTYVLICDDAGDERASILQLAELVRPYLREPAPGYGS
jgi:hypothetical protein